MRTLAIDLETYSSVDLAKSGVYAYASDFEILLFAYSVDNGQIQLIDIANGEKIPEVIIQAISDDAVIKTAFNAQFERVCLASYLNKPLLPVSWQCTAVQAAMLGLPLSLDGVAQVLGLEKRKMHEGKALIRYFSMPCKPTRSNGGRTRNLPCHDPDKWELFKQYNIRDVEVELAIREKLSA